MFRRLIGTEFETLPPAVRAVHDGSPERCLSGRCDVERGSGALSRLFCAVTSLPASGVGVPVRVIIRSDAHGESWSRDFGGKVMASTLGARGTLLHERLGSVVFLFRLRVADGAIEWSVERVSAVGIPLPARWFRRVTARESTDAGVYRFDVRAELPGVGLLVHYRGVLDVDP